MFCLLLFMRFKKAKWLVTHFASFSVRRVQRALCASVQPVQDEGAS